MSTRTFTLTGTLYNLDNTPNVGAPASVSLLTPGQAPVVNLEGREFLNGILESARADNAGAFSLTVVYTGDLRQADDGVTAVICFLVLQLPGYQIVSPASYAYAASIDSATWVPAPSTAGAIPMLLEENKIDNSPSQGAQVFLDISATAITPTLTDIRAGDRVLYTADSGGNIVLNLIPSALLNPADTTYVLYYVNDNSVKYFVAPTVPTGYQGAWNSGTTYHLNTPFDKLSPPDVVLSGGIYYEATADSLNHVPPNLTYWKVWAGEPVNWNITAAVITGGVAITTGGVAHDTSLPPLPDDANLAPLTLHDDLANLARRTGFATRALTGTAAALESDDWLFVSGASSAWTLTLMDVATRQRPLWVVLTDATHAVTISHAGSDTINGATTLVLSALHQWVCLKPPASGTDWAAFVPGSGGGAASYDWIAISATGGIGTTTTNELVDATGGAITRTLPTAASSTQRVSVKKKDSSVNAVTVATTGGQLIDGASTFVLASQYDSVSLVSDGTSAWYVE